MNKIIFTILFVVFASFNILGQQYYSRNYDINSGLPDNCIREIYKDSRGFLWIGTDAGLARFDGKHFSILTSQDGLAGNKIWAVTESADGNIWIGCHDGGLSVYNGQEIKTYTSESGLISNEIRKVYYSSKYDILLVGTEDGLSVYQDNNFISFHNKLNNVTQKLQITDILENNNIIYIFTSSNELYKYVPESKSLLRIPSDHALKKQYSNSAYISSFGDTLINMERNNLLAISHKTQNIVRNIGAIYDYKEDLNKNIWIASSDRSYTQSGGLFKNDSTGITNFNKAIGIKTNNVLSLEFDAKENLLWIGTKEYGLYLYPLTNFSYYQAKDFNLSELNITDLKSDSSYNVWISTKHSIIKNQASDGFKVFQFDVFQKEFEQFTQNVIKEKYSYLTDQEGSYEKYEHLISSGQYAYANPYKNLNGKEYPPRYFYKPLKYDVLANKNLTEFNSVAKDTSGNIWIGSNVGIFKMDKKTKKIKYFDLEGNQFKKFYFGPNNALYGLSWTELFIYPDIENSSEHYYFDYYEDKSPINVTSIRSNGHEVWFASSDHGLFVYDGKKFYSTFEQKNIGTPSFNDLCVDNYGNVVAAGNDGIIYFVQLLNDSIQQKASINIKNKNLGTNIRYLNCSETDQLIAGTNAGLNIIDLKSLFSTGELNIENIDESEGFKDYSGKVSITQDSDYLWIGSNKNLIKTKLSNLKNRNSKYYNFFIKSIYINDELLNLSGSEKNPWTNIPKINLELPYYKNSVTINFDVIRFLNPSDTKFSYKLEGFHKKWINNVKEGKAIFQNLEPGRYQFRIKLTGKNREISTQELSIAFTIATPIWQKWWVILIGIILLILLIRIFVIVRTRSIKKRERLRAEIAERITEFELKALRAQMNPHFIFNAINSIQNYMLDNDIDAALNYLSDFAKLIRLTLDNVSKKRISLDEELNYLKYYIKLEQMRFDKKFDLEIHVPSDVENSKILIPSMILQPFIENSIKHGFVFKESGGKITLEFKLTDDNILKCIIEDNGIGRKKSRELNKNKQKYTSRGTFITEERLALLNQTQRKKGYKVETTDLYDEFDLACGTRVEISLPV